METTDIDIVGYENYRCGGPQSKVNLLLPDYTIEDGECSTTVMEKTIILIIIGGTSFVILVVAAIIFWQHRWRLKKKMKKQRYRYVSQIRYSTVLVASLENTLGSQMIMLAQ